MKIPREESNVWEPDQERMFLGVPDPSLFS
jgi:hypothetical protein